MATVRNMTDKGTYCVYDDGGRYYHDLYEEQYVVLAEAEDEPNQSKQKQKKQKAYTFDKTALEDVMKCAICLEYMVQPMTLNECAHSYCKICLVTHLSVSKTCPLCMVHVNSKRDAWHNKPLEKLIDIYNSKKDTAPDVNPAELLLPNVPVVKKKRIFRCSVCKGWKPAPAQKCSFPCSESAL